MKSVDEAKEVCRDTFVFVFSAPFCRATPLVIKREANEYKEP